MLLSVDLGIAVIQASEVPSGMSPVSNDCLHSFITSPANSAANAKKKYAGSRDTNEYTTHSYINVVNMRKRSL